jgi:hypothetical protein
MQPKCSARNSRISTCSLSISPFITGISPERWFVKVSSSYPNSTANRSSRTYYSPASGTVDERRSRLQRPWFVAWQRLHLAQAQSNNTGAAQSRPSILAQGPGGGRSGIDCSAIDSHPRACKLFCQFESCPCFPELLGGVRGCACVARRRSQQVTPPPAASFLCAPVRAAGASSAAVLPAPAQLLSPGRSPFRPSFRPAVMAVQNQRGCRGGSTCASGCLQIEMRLLSPHAAVPQSAHTH